MKVLVTGGDGFLGKKIITLLKNKYQVKGTRFLKKDRRLIKLDLRSYNSVERVVKSVKPDIVIHTAAMVDISQCEDNKTEAFKINCLGSLYLARACRENKIRLIYISSDYVFSGTHSPYKEINEPHPINYYGLTKLIAEKNIQYIMKPYIIIRPTILYGHNDKDDKKTFITETLDNLKSGKEFFVDDVRIKYPILIDDVAMGVDYLIRKNKDGIFHFSGKEPLTRYQWALKMAEVFDYPKDKIKPKKRIDKNVSPARPVNINLQDIKGLKIRFRGVKEGLNYLKNFLF